MGACLMHHNAAYNHAHSAHDVPRTAAFKVDAKGVILEMPSEGAKIITSCSDEIRINTDKQIVFSRSGQRLGAAHYPPRANEVSRIFQTFSEAANSVLTIHIVPQKDGEATIVLFTQRAEKLQKLPPLSRREREVLSLAAMGLRRDRMAYRLGISVATVDLHCANLRKKLDAKTTSQAVAKGLMLLPS